MKKVVSLFLIFALFICALPLNASAEGVIPLSEIELMAPATPNNFVFNAGTEGESDSLYMIAMTDSSLLSVCAEYYSNNEAFCEKYNTSSFTLVLQYDVSLNSDEDWQYTQSWDTDPSAAFSDEYKPYWVTKYQMEKFMFFWLVDYNSNNANSFKVIRPAIMIEPRTDRNAYHFDTENNNLYIRCRYYMEWAPLDGAPGEKITRVSPWSDTAVFGKDSTQHIPEEPVAYDAPIISDMKIMSPNIVFEKAYIQYTQTVPESVWMANVYYLMTGNGQIDGVETQISIEGGEWTSYNTENCWGDWSLVNGDHTAYGQEMDIDENTNVKLRIRFLGTHGPSPWSNVLEVNSGEYEEIIPDFPDGTSDLTEESRESFEDIQNDSEEIGNALGDVNADAFIDSLDAALILKHDACIAILDDALAASADVNGDGFVDSLDAAQILKYDAGLITSF